MLSCPYPHAHSSLLFWSSHLDQAFHICDFGAPIWIRLFISMSLEYLIVYGSSFPHLWLWSTYMDQASLIYGFGAPIWIKLPSSLTLEHLSGSSLPHLWLWGTYLDQTFHILSLRSPHSMSFHSMNLSLHFFQSIINIYLFLIQPYFWNTRYINCSVNSFFPKNLQHSIKAKILTYFIIYFYLLKRWCRGCYVSWIMSKWLTVYLQQRLKAKKLEL